jgi:Complex 1 protein (LYR family)
MSTNKNVLTVYKNLLKLANKLPEPKRLEGINMIRSSFRKNTSASPSEVQNLLQKANSSLGYLKMITPKQASEQKERTYVTKITVGDIDGRKSASKATTNWHGRNLDPDSVKRHYNNLKRAGFKSNQDAKGFF